MVKLNVLNININIEVWHKDKRETIVMLHGFTGSTKTWETLATKLPHYKIVVIDLMGHGLTEVVEDVNVYGMESQIHILHAIITRLQLTNFTLLGYSMGGRIALSYALQHPHEVRGLILESASPGLESMEEQKERKAADNALANRIETEGIEAFVEFWENIPLFASQKSLPLDVQQAIRAERLSQNRLGLANSLRGMGTGVMPSLWHRLVELPMPVTLMTGELDSKFVNIADRMTKLIKNVRHVTVNEVGHAIHVENPSEFATIVKETISLNP
ncbi:2-succinyl-6-hydroxy-2,4-cyclohexadiene-1-carboxylate synthase [Lysinibacillus sp. 54212]|uniref:2-succinyl-6-hydroxy-2, 4-cyclohexadiene-1-carboxylate synthase n=1 Tax=Lysinibacillus sp. 54212 TaxID=3119829 RepID=UPI002FC9E35D